MSQFEPQLVSEGGHKTLLIQGCPKGGTTYLSNLLRRAGAHIGHERPDAFGLCTGFFHSRHHWYPIPSNHPDAYEFDHRWWLMRHPLTAVPSLAWFLTGRDRFLGWFHQLGYDVPASPQGATNGDLLHYGLVVWLETHWRVWEQTPPQGLRLELERIPKHWPLIRQTLGWQCAMPQVPIPNPTSATHRAGPIGWGDLEALDPGRARLARALYRRFCREARKQRGA